jgi:ABC-type sugar transport system substrate-binding protein
MSKQKPYRFLATGTSVIAISALAVTGFGPSATASALTGNTASSSLAGKEICYTSPANIDVMNEMFNDITKAAAKSKVKVEVTNANGSTAAGLQQAQQFLASGQCNAIGVVTGISPSSAPIWQKLASSAAKQHVVLANFSADWITGAALNVSNPHCPGGQAVAVPAAAWYKAHGDGGQVGMITAPYDAELTMRTKCFEQTFLKLVGKPVQFWSAADNVGGVTDSATAASNLLEAHPAIDVLFGWGSDTSVGITRAANEAGHTDPSKFFVGAMDLYAPSLATLATGKSVLQAGTVFDYDYAGVSWNYAIENLMLGKKVPATGVALPIALNSSSAAQVSHWDSEVISNPNMSFFAKAMVYCNIQEKTGNPYPPTSACSPDTALYSPPQ